MIDFAEAGKEVGTIYITKDEMAQIEREMAKNGQAEQYQRFLKRLKKYQFLKTLMRKVNLELDKKYQHLQ